nr:hypothetical protein Iba_chr12fCG21210 [Ipomoea batatas]
MMSPINPKTKLFRGCFYHPWSPVTRPKQKKNHITAEEGFPRLNRDSFRLFWEPNPGLCASLKNCQRKCSC